VVVTMKQPPLSTLLSVSVLFSSLNVGVRPRASTPLDLVSNPFVFLVPSGVLVPVFGDFFLFLSGLLRRLILYWLDSLVQFPIHSWRDLGQYPGSMEFPLRSLLR